MSKEINWNTVETVWDYEHLFKKGDAEEYGGSRSNYVKELKEDKARSNFLRLLDLETFFLWRDEKKHAEIYKELEKDEYYIRERKEEEYLLQHNLG